jgi:hypothetical protein
VAIDVAADRDAPMTKDLRDTLSGTPGDNMTEAAECRSVCTQPSKAALPSPRP